MLITMLSLIYNDACNAYTTTLKNSCLVTLGAEDNPLTGEAIVNT